MANPAIDAATAALHQPLTPGATPGLMPQTSPGELSRAVADENACTPRHSSGETRCESQVATDVSAFGAAAIASCRTVPARVSHHATPDAGLVGLCQEHYESYCDALQAVTSISLRHESLANHKS